MPVMLPDAVQQQLGLMPPPAPPIDQGPGPGASSSGPPSFLPSIAAIQATPALSPAPAPNLPPPSLDNPPQFGAAALSSPSAGSFGPGAPPDRDYHVPVSAVMPQPQHAAAQHAPVTRPPSPDQQLALAQGKQGAADQTSLGAIDTQEAVNRAKAASDLSAFNAHDENAKKLEDDRKSWQAEYAKTHQQKQAYVDATLKDVDNFHVDPNKYEKEMGLGDHLRWGIGMVLAGVGQAMQHQGGPNPVLQMLQDKMHQSVVAQMDQRDQLKERAGRAEHQLDKYDAFSQNRDAQMNLLDARNDKLLASTLMTSAAKYADPQAQANAQKEAATLLQSSAEKAEKAAQFAAGNDIAKKQLATSQANTAIAGGHLALAQKQFDWTKDKDQQTLDLEAAKLAIADAKAKKQNVADQGIFNPITGNGLLTARGKEMVATADRLEAAARTDPGHAQDYGAQAQQLREAANTGEVATIADKEDRRKVTDGLASAQTLIDTTGKIREFLRSDPDITDREGWAKVQALYGTAIADYTHAIGARPSSREFEAINKHIMTYNPDSWVDRAIRKAPGVASLEGLEESVKAGVDAMLKSKGIKDGWIPASGTDNPAATFGGKTAAEVGADEAPGKLDRAATLAALRIGNPFGTAADEKADEKAQAPQDAAFEKALSRTNAAGQSSNYGLDPVDDSKASALVSKAQTAGNAERSRIIEQLTAPIIQQNRPSLAAGLLNLVHDQDPGLYKEILDRLPPLQAKQIQDMDAVRSKFPGSDVGSQVPAPMPSDAVRAYNSKLEAQGLPPIRM